MGIGVGTLVAGLFGMNVRSRFSFLYHGKCLLRGMHMQLRSHMEEHDYGFFAMSLVALITVGLFSSVGLRRYVPPTSHHVSSPQLTDVCYIADWHEYAK